MKTISTQTAAALRARGFKKKNFIFPAKAAERLEMRSVREGAARGSRTETDIVLDALEIYYRTVPIRPEDGAVHKTIDTP